MNKILYLHGFSSSGQSATPAILRNKLPDMEVISPDIPVSIKEALPFLKNLCEEINPTLIVGTSMGGFYAQLLKGYRKILVNPAFEVSRLMQSNIGECKWINTRLNGDKTFLLTKEMTVEYNDIEKIQFENISTFDRENTIGLFAENDELVDEKPTFLKHYNRCFFAPGGHVLSPTMTEYYLAPLIKDVLRNV